MWGDDERGEAEEAVASNHSVVFSLAPPSDALEDARRVVRDLIATAERGRRRRRRLAAGAPATEPDAVGTQPRDGSPPEEEEGGRRRGWRPRQLSIQEAFSLTRRGGGDRPRAASRAAWSRVLARGLESGEEDAGGPTSCAARLLAAGRALAAPSSSLPSSYEISLFAPAPPPPSPVAAAAADRDDRDATADAASPPPPPVSPECLASVVAGLAVHPAVVRVGVLPASARLDDAGAQWVLQGAARADDGPRGGARRRKRRPFFEAGLDGGGQVVSVADTGLDLDNCHFRDLRGRGDVFARWDYSRRKVVRYAVSPRGGDRGDARRGHGEHERRLPPPLFWRGQELCLVGSPESYCMSQKSSQNFM